MFCSLAYQETLFLL